MNIVLLGFGELKEGGWTNPQWMAQTIHERGENVTYFNPPPYRRLRFADFKRFFFRLKKSKSLSYKFKSFSVFYPFKFLGYIFNKRIYTSLSRADVIIIFQPNWISAIDFKAFNEKKIIYFKTDDYISVAKDKIKAEFLENCIVKLADTVCVTSKNLLKNNKKFYYFPNCIPKSLIDSANFKNNKNISKDLKACFIGAIWEDKVDIEMLVEFINNSHNVQFHFAGKILSKRFNDFIKNSPKNFKYHGVLSFKEAQNLASFCDVGLMPFLINSYTDSMFSMKFFEYMAAGLPVLTTKIKMINDIMDYNKYMLVSDSFTQDNLIEAKKIFMDPFEIRQLLSKYTYEKRIEYMHKLEII